MNYTFQHDGNITVLMPTGNILSEDQTKEIKGFIDEEIKNQRINFVVDLSKIVYINSLGLGLLMTMLTKARQANGEMVLACVPEQLKKLLVITKLNTFFPSFDSTAESVDFLKSK